jgi:hypothetical protein
MHMNSLNSLLNFFGDHNKQEWNLHLVQTHSKDFP